MSLYKLAFYLCCFTSFFSTCLLASVAPIYENRNQPNLPTRMTRNLRTSEFIIRKRIPTTSGSQVYHCVRDTKCYRADPENMFIYKKHWYQSRKSDTRLDWLAAQPRYLKSSHTNKRLDKRLYTQSFPKTSHYQTVRLNTKAMFYQKDRFRKSRLLGTYDTFSRPLE